MIRQLTSQKDCSICRGCCSFFDPDSCWTPILLEEEALELERQSLLGKASPPQIKVPLLPGPSGTNNFICSFFESTPCKCRIYPHRPIECQLYPFLINRTEEGVFLAADLNCPVVNEKHRSKEFKEYAAYLLELLDSPGYLRILKRNPQIVRRYDKVINIARLKASR